MVLRLVHGLPPQDAPAAVGTAFVPVLPRVGSTARAFLLVLLAVQPAVPSRRMRGLRTPGSDPPGPLPIVPLPGPVPGRSLAVDTGPLHFAELGPSGHQLFFASMIAVSWNHGRKVPGPPAAPVPPGPYGMIGPEAIPRQPELFTLPFEMTPWRILDGDWPGSAGTSTSSPPLTGPASCAAGARASRSTSAIPCGP